MNKKVDIRNISLQELDERLEQLGFKPDTRSCIFPAIYCTNSPDFNSLERLTPGEYSLLNKTFTLPKSQRDELLKSRDGSYRLTLRLTDDSLAETVIIPEWDNGILKKCSISISSQIGCFFGCSFCATGQLGFHRNLTTGELIDQFLEAKKVIDEELNASPTHLYFMGMGEPMHNYRSLSDALAIIGNPSFPGLPLSHTTVSTVGLFKQIRMLAKDHPNVRLAVSIHSADQSVRQRIMPVSARLELSEIREALRHYNRVTGNPVTIQYLLLDGVNDDANQAEKLVQYLENINANITLIMYNDILESDNARPDSLRLERFTSVLLKAGFRVDTRWCYGEDIQAGCGQLQSHVTKNHASRSMRHAKPKT